MDPFGFLDAVFSGGDSSTTQGSPAVSSGSAPVIGWMLGQSFAGAGPVGQYLGLLYTSPGSGIQNVEWERQQQARAERGRDTGGRIAWEEAGEADSHQPRHDDGPDPAEPVATDQPGTPRTLEVLDRDGTEGSHRHGRAADASIQEVRVLGSPPVRPQSGWSEAMLFAPTYPVRPGPEIRVDVGGQPLGQQRRRSPRRPAAPHPTDSPDQPEVPEARWLDSGPYFDVDVVPTTVPNDVGILGAPWRSDMQVATDYLPLWALQPEKQATPRWEHSAVRQGRIETVPTAPVGRSFWDRGGTGLTAGALTAATGVAVLLWWNPVGWVAAASVALAIAGGVAATAGSAVELAASYGGVTTAHQDAELNRAISATLGYSSVGAALGATAGTVLADDPRAGFDTGAAWTGLATGAGSLAIAFPGMLRRVPGLWRTGMPWAKSLLLAPFWTAMGTSAGGGSPRALARTFTAQGRIGSRIRTVENLGPTPLLERDAAWARYQVFATGSRSETAFRLTTTGGHQRIVLADRFLARKNTILEAKYGDLGMMWDPQREAHIIGQARNYLDITTVTHGQVGYLVSTERGALRLSQRFAHEFPHEMTSGQLWIDWIPWHP